MITWILAVAAAVIALWPSKTKNPFQLPVELDEKKDDPVDFLEAFAALQVVRSRLIATDKLGQECFDACSVLAMALTEGSETE